MPEPAPGPEPDRDPTGPPRATGLLSLTVQPLLWGGPPRSLRVLVDGRPLPVAVGENTLTVPVGPHHVEVHVPFRPDPAEAVVEVAADVPVRLWYVLPFGPAFGGTLGTRPQPAHGSRFLALTAAFLVVGLLVTYLR